MAEVLTDADILLNFTNDGPVAQPDPWKECLNYTEARQ